MQVSEINRTLRVSCQGRIDVIRQTHRANDFYKFHLAAMIIQETHMKETGLYKVI